MKNKKIAGFLALFFGVFGVHRFYLGQRFIGALHLFLLFFGIFILETTHADVPIPAIPALIGFIDAILFFAMPKEDFDDKYNARRKAQFQRDYGYEYSHSAPQKNRQASQARRTKNFPPKSRPISPFKKMGIEKFRDYDFEGAVIAFQKALDYHFDDPATHFNLACCYSIMEEAEKSFHHLEKAVEFGFSDLKKIHSHDALAFLRSQPGFSDFADNNYRQIAALPEPQQGILDEAPKSETDDLLEQIIKLGDLRDKGILTEAEFASQKKKLLGE